MARRLFICISITALLGIAACQPNAVDPNAQVVDNRPPIDWDRNPNTVVFRADVTGGSVDPFVSRNDMPYCTVYGDNHIVWINELGPFETQVLEDRVSDEKMRDFIYYVGIEKNIYQYDQRQDNQPASSNSPVVETLSLNVNGVLHETDPFSGWDFDYYSSLLKACKDISEAPVLFEPAAAYVSARTAIYDPTSPSIFWDPQANGLSLAELAASGERRWITDRNVRVLWQIIRTSPPSIIFNENELQYQVALEIPNITRNAPAAPS
jgi:hypothetical protein